jgi:hypothetical protein
MEQSEQELLRGTAAIAAAGRSQLNRIFELISALGGRTSPADSLEEDSFRVREGFHNFRLELVEPEHSDIDFSKSPRPDNVNLVYFARTMQRTQLIGHFVHRGIEVPLHYSITGAIVLQRVGRKFRVWGEPELRNNVLVPFQFVENRSILEQFESTRELRLVDTGGERAEYTQLRIAAVKCARELTLELRGRLYLKWRKAEGADLSNYLVASGMVADVPNKWLTKNFVALARRVYVPWQNSELLEPQLAIPAFQRGQVMRTVNAVGDDTMEKYTWFVRLRSSSQADPEFGLLRCTCIADNDAEAVQRADAISARLIDERVPVTFPAEHWDRLIFPLKLCRDFLESMVPTRATVKSYFARA